MKIIIHNNIRLTIYDNGSFEAVHKNDKHSRNRKTPERLNFDISVCGSEHIRLAPDGFRFVMAMELDGGIGLTYVSEKYSLEVYCELRFAKGADVIIQKNSVRNIGSRDIRLTGFSSGLVGNISPEPAWYKNEMLRIHICHSSWQGEGQWREYSLQELGLYPSTSHSWEKKIVEIASSGSWSTAKYYPLVMAEDRRRDCIWYMETEGSHSWEIDLKEYGGYAEPYLAMEAYGSGTVAGDWHYNLKPGEVYSAERSFWGVTKGGFENAVAQLNIFKRQDTEVIHKNGVPPVVFNDYMNCIWIDQSPKRIFPLIDRAAEAGCEIFVVDDCWSENAHGLGKGDWEPKKSLYKDIDLKAIAERITERGMIPGIWFELESVDSTAAGARLNENAVLKKDDIPIGDNEEYFYNMTDAEVRVYLKDRIREVYDIGYRFIKNDYNRSIKTGCTNSFKGNSPDQGLIEHSDAFYNFICELYDEFPGLIVENCASGAMRSDNKMLRHCAFQSITDQEFYYNIPSIVMGSIAVMPPEKAGIWSCPYPAGFYEYKNFKPEKEYIRKMADGRQTVFSMVTAMTGLLYQSGRIDLCDDKNFSYIRKGIWLYKRIREYIPQSRPVYPLGMRNINTEGDAALGLLSEHRLLLAVWNIKRSHDNIECDISSYVGRNASIETLYCAESERCTIGNGIITVEMSGLSAVFAVISF